MAASTDLAGDAGIAGASAYTDGDPRPVQPALDGIDPQAQDLV